MPTGRALHRAGLAVALLSCGIAGCSQQVPFLARRTSLGALKTSVVQLETENSKLRTELAQSQAEARKVEDNLVKYESVNGELKARLDDARVQISDQGGTTRSAGLEPESETRSTRNAAPVRPARSRARKPPVANINGPGDSYDESSQDSFGPPDEIPPVDTPRRKATPSRKTRDEDEGWLPITRPGQATGSN
jgi:septal ring factor EnvC (AmiA/AmiB activator)